MDLKAEEEPTPFRLSPALAAVLVVAVVATIVLGVYPRLLFEFAQASALSLGGGAGLGPSLTRALELRASSAAALSPDAPGAPEYHGRRHGRQEAAVETVRQLGALSTVGLSFVLAIVIGAWFGKVLDNWLGTSPWLFFLFFFFGLAAGIINVYRTAGRFLK